MDRIDFPSAQRGQKRSAVSIFFLPRFPRVLQHRQRIGSPRPSGV